MNIGKMPEHLCVLSYSLVQHPTPRMSNETKLGFLYDELYKDYLLYIPRYKSGRTSSRQRLMSYSLCPRSPVSMVTVSPASSRR